MARFLGRGTKTELHNSLISSFEWQHAMDTRRKRKDLVSSVKLHFGLTLYPLSLPLVPYPLILFISRNLGEGCSCHCSCYCYPKQK